MLLKNFDPRGLSAPVAGLYMYVTIIFNYPLP